jgi:SHS2 domain-containing protein
MESGFRILEHPSDMGIEASGADLSEAFRQAAFGLISIIVDPSSVQSSVRKEIVIEGSDIENLLVLWLSELLYLYDGQDFVVGSIDISELSLTRLRAILHGEYVDEKKHRLRMDVKAVTYHQLGVSQGCGGATVRVFLDI